MYVKSERQGAPITRGPKSFTTYSNQLNGDGGKGVDNVIHSKARNNIRHLYYQDTKCDERVDTTKRRRRYLEHELQPQPSLSSSETPPAPISKVTHLPVKQASSLRRSVVRDMLVVTSTRILPHHIPRRQTTCHKRQSSKQQH